MRLLNYFEQNVVSGGRVIMLSSQDSTVYIITEKSEFQLDEDVKLTSSMLYIDDEPCPDAFKDSGAQSKNARIKAYPVANGTRYVKVV